MKIEHVRACLLGLRFEQGRAFHFTGKLWELLWSCIYGIVDQQKIHLSACACQTDLLLVLQDCALILALCHVILVCSILYEHAHVRFVGSWLLNGLLFSITSKIK
jgi:hypothetical protein